MNPDKVACPHCAKLLSARYLKTHIDNQHNKSSTNPKLMAACIDIISGNAYQVPQEADPIDLAVLDNDDFPYAMSISEQETPPARRRAQPEKAIQLKLEKRYNGKHQETDAGIIDILTETEIIETKEWKAWKGAIGQLYAYGHYYPNHMKHMHLFGPHPNEKLKQVIFSVCAGLRIRVTFEPNTSTIK